MRKKLVGSALGGVVVGVIAVLIVLNVFAPASTTTGTPSKLSTSMGVKLVIQVHRTDGTTQTYVKKGDLVLLNFARFLVKVTAGQNDPDGEDDMVKTDGTTIRYNTGDYGPNKAQIWLGNASSPSATINDYTFNAPIKFNVQDADIITSGNNMTVDIFGSYTLDHAFNATQIGLVIIDSFNAKVLIFHDVLPTPIHLSAGDGITVHYYIHINNPS